MKDMKGVTYVRIWGIWNDGTNGNKINVVKERLYMKILIVDDEVKILEVIDAYLVANKFSVYKATND